MHMKESPGGLSWAAVQMGRNSHRSGKMTFQSAMAVAKLGQMANVDPWFILFRSMGQQHRTD